MRVVVDIEANGLENPTKIWCVVCKDIDTGEYHIFRNIVDDATEREKYIRFARQVRLWVGHNFIGYDGPNLTRLVPDPTINYYGSVVDTLVISKLIDYSRPAHSIEDYGVEFGLPKQVWSDFTKWSPELEAYCITDVDICHRVLDKYHKVYTDDRCRQSLLMEQEFQLVTNDLHTNGFYFDTLEAHKLLQKVTLELQELDGSILLSFPPREVLVREFTPRATKHGTISRTSVPRSLWGNISEYEVGKTYRQTRMEDFNPSSHKQLVNVLSEAGWKPEDKTQTHIDTERELNRLKYGRGVDREIDPAILQKKLDLLRQSGWKINETNLGTLPDTAPPSAKLLAKRILLESRRRTLTEWLALISPAGRIHGRFYGIGAWTHRMAHQNPNTANIPTDVKLYGAEMRSLWRAPPGRLLVGVDAEGIQLRIFAHYIKDAEFTEALVKGRKEDKSDPHSLNQRILGSVCSSRQIAKRFIYALLLGAGIGKLAQILGCQEQEAREALARLMQRYQGFQTLKESVIPADARRGYFIGLDGRKVSLPGQTAGERRHLVMSGYLQNGEAIVMKRACLKWYKKLKDWDAKLVNFVHDEWIIEVPDDRKIAEHIGMEVARSLKVVGEELGLKCPLAGSMLNAHDKKAIGLTWLETH